MNMAFESGQTIQTVCKGRNLDDLVKVWDVKLTIPVPSSSAAIENALHGKAENNTTDKQEAGDLHNYDDRYFLDHDKFRKERSDAVSAALTTSDNSKVGVGEEKKPDDACEQAEVCSKSDGPATKRTKL